MIIKVSLRSTERRQLEESFIQRELEATNEEVKQPQRERVAKFFAAHHDKGYTRCFCLPGARWAFENELEKHFDRPINFIGVERNYTIMEAGLNYMPGKSRIYCEEETKYRIFRGYSTNRGRVFWSDASVFMGYLKSAMLSKKQSWDWMNKYKRWTCAWLDLSSMIAEEFMTCCKRIDAHLDMVPKVVPVAVTFMIGRETPGVTQYVKQLSRGEGALDDRVQFIRAMWEGNKFRTAEIADAWTYKSAGGCPMGVVMAMFKRKDK